MKYLNSIKIKRFSAVFCACLIGLLSVLSVVFVSSKDNSIVSASAEEVSTSSATAELAPEDYNYYVIYPQGFKFHTDNERMSSVNGLGFFNFFDYDYSVEGSSIVAFSYFFMYYLSSVSTDFNSMFSVIFDTTDYYNFTFYKETYIPVQMVNYNWLADTFTFDNEGYANYPLAVDEKIFTLIIFDIDVSYDVYSSNNVNLRLRRVPKDVSLNGSGEVDRVGFLNEVSADMYWFKARLNDGATDFSDFTLLDSAFAVSCNVEFDTEEYNSSPDSIIPTYKYYPTYHITTDYTNLVSNPYSSLAEREFVGMYLQVNFNPLWSSDTLVFFGPFDGFLREIIYKRLDTGDVQYYQADILNANPYPQVDFWAYKYLKHSSLFNQFYDVAGVRFYDLTYGAKSYDLDDMRISNNKLIDYSYTQFMKGYDVDKVGIEDEAYNRGYNTGAEDASTYTFMNLITSLIDAPVKVFLNIVDFEILGMDMQKFFLSLLSVALIIAAYRLFSGGTA